MRYTNRGLQFHQSVDGSTHPADLDETRQSQLRAARRQHIREQMADTPASDL